MNTKFEVDELVKKSKAGDSTSFGKIYDLLLDRVYRFVYFRIGNKEETEDLTQVIFFKIWQNLVKYQQRDGVPFEAWVFRIARNQLADYYRVKKITIPIDEIEIEDTKPSPEQIADNVLNKDRVLKGLKKLNDSYREIIIMKFIEDLSNKEISKILKKQESYVRVLQNRALKALRKVIENEK